MKKVILVAAAGLLLASVAAYAQMKPEGRPDAMAQMHGGHGGGHMMGQGMMHGGGSHGMMAGMHGGMMQGGGAQGGMMHGGSHGMMGGMMQGGMHGGSHGGGAHADGMQPKGDTGPSSLAFHGINRKMHEGMNIAYTGNADVDFVTGMIPHHQGAVDMAKTVLAFGKDPEIRKLAEEIVKAQETEIGQMQAWLKKSGQ
jgi:hypothetical protein